MFGWGTWNGASYYIEVFSERYKLQFMQVIGGRVDGRVHCNFHMIDHEVIIHTVDQSKLNQINP